MTIADIQSEVRAITDTDSTSLTNATLLYRVNNAYEEIMAKLFMELGAGSWPPGDINYTAFPTYTQNLVNAQQAYQIDSFGADADERPLVILGVEVVDNNGASHVLSPITLRRIHDLGFAQSRYESTNGLPREYEKREHMLVLYPAPATANVTLTNGLRAFFLRRADVYTSAEVTTGTKEPGFPSPYHILVAYKAALPHIQSYKRERLPWLINEITRLERDLLKFVSRSNQDDRPIMSMRPVEHI